MDPRYHASVHEAAEYIYSSRRRRQARVQARALGIPVGEGGGQRSRTYRSEAAEPEQQANLEIV